MARREVSVDELNDVMSMDHVIRVWPDGTVSEPRDVHAPDLDDGEVSGAWDLMNGYSGQYGYSGPLMHQSEYIGGGLARDILAAPGWYAAVYEGDEWAVAYVLAECEGHPGNGEAFYCDGTCINPNRH